MMLRFLKELVLAFKPLTDAEVMQMRLDGPQPPKKQPPDLGVAEMEDDGSIRIKPEAIWDNLHGPHRHTF